MATTQNQGPPDAGKSQPEVEVIICTLAESSRADGLWRALASIGAQRDVRTRAIVVVNGQQFDPGLVDALKNRSDIVFSRLKTASLALSRIRGQQLVKAPVFAYLDDDDELVANTLHYPCGWLQEHSDCDVAITNLYTSSGGTPRLGPQDMHACAHRPMEALLRNNWLASGCGFFRTATVSRTILDVQKYHRQCTSHQEWTRTAFHLVAANKRLHFMDVATVVYHDTPASMSKGTIHQESAIRLLREIISHPHSNPAIRRQARIKLCNTHHVLALRYWNEGRRLKAWHNHLRSFHPYLPPRYFLFTRKLIIPRRAGILPTQVPPSD